MVVVGDEIVIVHSSFDTQVIGLQMSVGDRVTVSQISNDDLWAWCRDESGKEDFVPVSYLRQQIITIVGKRQQEPEHEKLRQLELKQQELQKLEMHQQEILQLELQQKELLQKKLEELEIQQQEIQHQLGKQQELLQQLGHQQEQPESEQHQLLSEQSSGVNSSSSPSTSSNSASSLTSVFPNTSATALPQIESLQPAKNAEDSYEGCCWFTVVNHFSVVPATPPDGSPTLDLTVRLGEVLWGSIETHNNKRWLRSTRLPGQQGYVPSDCIRMASALETEPWFVGRISREESENLLMQSHIPIGTFMVRESETTSGYVISLKDCKEGSLSVRHRKITITLDGYYTAWNGYMFTTVPNLVNGHISPEGGRKLVLPYNKEPNPFSYKMGTRPGGPFTSPSHFHASFPSKSPHNLRFTPPTTPTPRTIARTPSSLLTRTDQYTETLSKAQQTSSVSRTDLSSVPPENSTRMEPSTLMSYYSKIPKSQDPIAHLPKAPIEVVSRTEDMLPEPQSSGESTGHEEWTIDARKVELLDRIGSGYYGEVWKAKFVRLKKIIAMKTFNPNTMKMEHFLNEVDAMKDLRHPYLVKLYGVCPDASKPFMLVEYYSNGSVLDYCRQGREMSSSQKLLILEKVASGMKYLSDLEYIHRDLAARNVLLADDLSPRVADFGLARLAKTNKNTDQGNLMMPWKWTAPEAMGGRNEWSSKCDVWSYGVFCWELYSKCSTNPYPGITTSLILRRFLASGDRLQQPVECDSEIYGIMQKCWQCSVEDRITFAEILNFFKFDYSLR